MVASVSTSSRYKNFPKRSKDFIFFVPPQNRWSPTYDVSAILTSIQSLLSDPNPNSPANSMAAQLFKVLAVLNNCSTTFSQENRREYEKRVKACVEQSWCDD